MLAGTASALAATLGLPTGDLSAPLAPSATNGVAPAYGAVKMRATPAMLLAASAIPPAKDRRNAVSSL